MPPASEVAWAGGSPGRAGGSLAISQEEGRLPLRSRGRMAPQALLALLQPTGKGWAPEPETQPGRTGSPLGSSRAKESLSSRRTMAEGQQR